MRAWFTVGGCRFGRCASAVVARRAGVWGEGEQVRTGWGGIKPRQMGHFVGEGMGRRRLVLERTRASKQGVWKAFRQGVCVIVGEVGEMGSRHIGQEVGRRG